MEKNVRSNVTVILIVRHLQTHYATNHLYYVFTAKVARSIRLLNFSMYLNYIDWRQCEIQFKLRVFQTIQDILRNLQMIWTRSELEQVDYVVFSVTLAPQIYIATRATSLTLRKIRYFKGPLTQQLRSAPFIAFIYSSQVRQIW